jgi:rhamnogalacturonan acetylesterase
MEQVSFTLCHDSLAPPLDVVIEFGHNDGGSPASNTHAEVYGEDESTTKTVILPDGTIEVVYTF